MSTKLQQDAFGQYLQQIGSYELLTVDQEADRAKRIAAGRAASELLDAEVTANLGQVGLKLVVEDGLKAKEDMTNRNLRLVIGFAKKYKDSSVNIIDAVQAGNEGLMKAVDKFDQTKGYRFSTYATWWIRQQIQRYNPHQSAAAFRVPSQVYDMTSKVRAFENQFVSTHGELPSDQEIMEEFGLSAEKFRLLKQANLTPASLNAHIGGDDQSAQFGEIIADPNSSATEQVEHDSDKETLKHLLDSLDERSRYIITMRYGLNGEEKTMTLQEIGDKIGVTRESIRLQEKRAIRRLEELVDIKQLSWHPTNN